jgi:hypothetical protein
MFRNREEDAAGIGGGAPARHLDDLQPAAQPFGAEDRGLLRRDRAAGLLEAGFENGVRSYRVIAGRPLG